MDLELISSMGQEMQGVFVPVPLFILSPAAINQQNKIILDEFLKIVKQDKEFIEVAKLENGKLLKLVAITAKYELWKRSLLMRIQWFLQLFCIISILYWILS